MADEYIRKQDAINVAQNYHCSHDITIIPNTDYSRGFYDGLAIRENDILQGLSELKPSADVVQVVMCKDCKHNANPPEAGNANCDLFYGMTEQYGFCHRAERRADG